MKNCAGCKFYIPIMLGCDGGCHRYPVALRVLEMHWCGEFQPSVEVVEQPAPEGLGYYRGEFYESGRKAAEAGICLSCGPSPESAQGIDWAAGWIDQSREKIARIT